MPERVRFDQVWRDPGLYAVVLFTLVYNAPVFRVVNWLGDEGLLLHGAVRMLDGQTPYRDFFAVFPPGAFFVVAGWFTAFGTSFVSARALVIATLALIAALVYVAARLTSGRRSIALALALVCGVRGPFEGNHHWLATAASMASAVALLTAVGASRPALGASFVAGFFAGAAGMILQTRGAYLACAMLVSLLLTTERWRRLAAAVAGMAVVPTAAIGYLAATGALRVAFDDIVLFPFRHYSAIQHVPFGSFTRWAEAGVVAFFPATLVAAIVAARLGWWRTPRFRASLALAVAGLAGAYPRPDMWHLAFVIPMAAPMLALGVGATLDTPTGMRRVVIGALLLASFTWYVGYAVAERIVTATRARVETIVTARGRIVGYPRQWTTDLAWVAGEIERRTTLDDGLFFYPYLPMLSYLTARRQVAGLDIVVPGYTTPEQYRDVCGEVTGAAQWVVVERQWLRPEHWQKLFPAMADPSPPERRALETMLDRGFERVAATTHFELRQRTARASPALCAAVAAGRGTLVWR